jgi:uncharacterized protein YqcC (DUF446 family)
VKIAQCLGKLEPEHFDGLCASGEGVSVQPEHGLVKSKIDEVESEMRRIGMWQGQPPAPERLVVTQAFGGDKLSFEQWLQFILIPRVREIIAEGGGFPRGSQVSDQAFREWRMWGDMPDVDRLLQLLREFDALFN